MKNKKNLRIKRNYESDIKRMDEGPIEWMYKIWIRIGRRGDNYNIDKGNPYHYHSLQKGYSNVGLLDLYQVDFKLI